MRNVINIFRMTNIQFVVLLEMKSGRGIYLKYQESNRNLKKKKIILIEAQSYQCRRNKHLEV